MPNKVDDLALLRQPVPLKLDGAEAVIKYWEGASPEVRSLISNECSVIFECRECRNLFRSIVNFISHKRVICRSLLEVPGPSSLDVQQIAEKTASEMDLATTSSNFGSVEPTEAPVKKKAFLRRTNIVSVISKRAEHYSKKLSASKDTVFLNKLPSVWRSIPTTTFKSGQQIFVTAPQNMAQKEPLISDKVTLVVPQDHSIKYREMNLRRRENDPKIAPARYASFDERVLADRLCSYPDLADAGLLTCMHSDCIDKQPFSSLHTYDIVVSHLKKHHNKYYEEHRLHRLISNDERSDSKKNRKRKNSEKIVLNEHSGSLSPVSDYSEESDTPDEVCRFEYNFKNCSALDAVENGH
uniref:C2H2-type domain-containing protein n=1 Tax=Syphacia muris TaxID=451379 RepID=A0A158R5L9_9BILA